MLKEFITAGEMPSFINGALCPPGTRVYVDTAVIEPGPNLVDPGERPVLIPTPVAAMFPTGPNPTAPQQVPPGALQTADGYASGPHLYVGPAHELLDTPAADGDADAAVKADYAAFVAWRKERDAALTAAPVTEAKAEPDTFDAAATIDGTIPDVVGRLDGLTAEQLKSVRTAEGKGSNRAGVNNAIDAALAKL